MTTPLVIPGICRYTVNQKFGTVEMKTVLDMHVDTQTGNDRSVALNDCAGNILNAWYDNLRPQMSEQHQVTGVDYIDLDTETGPVGSRISTSAHTAPFAGTVAGATLPSFVQVLIKKKTDAVRGGKTGRWFWTGLSESWTDAGAPNVFSPAALANFNTALAAFLSAIDHGFGTGTYASDLVVVHRHGGVSGGTWSKVSALQAQSKLTILQRRRAA